MDEPILFEVRRCKDCPALYWDNQERIECQLDLSFDNIKPTLKGKPPKGCPLRLNPITLKLAEKA